MWELDQKEGWAPKNWCFQTVVLEKIFASPLDSKEIKPVNPEGNQAWIFTGRTDAEAEAPILWPPDAKNWLTGKDPDAGKDWGQEEKGTTEEEMVRWHHQLTGHEFEQTLGDSGGQGSLHAAVHGVAKSQTRLSDWNDWSTLNQGKLEVVRQEMARVNINILGISELKWTRMSEFNSDDHTSTTVGKNPIEEME